MAPGTPKPRQFIHCPKLLAKNPIGRTAARLEVGLGLASCLTDDRLEDRVNLQRALGNFRADRAKSREWEVAEKYGRVSLQLQDSAAAGRRNGAFLPQ